MKEIKIKSITLHNWRGEKDRTTEFHLDAPTYICGDNGLGKSRHFDAFCWLLFGKDSQDRKDFELRTYDEKHHTLHKCECFVEATLLVNDEILVLKREYKERWEKPRGTSIEVFRGNTTECTWNGTPVKVTEYTDRVSSMIIDETLFKMITNPVYFAEKMDWNSQRDILIEMAGGTKTDMEIAAGHETFMKLLDELKDKSWSDFRKEIAVEKKRLKAAIIEIKPRIDQTQKMMPKEENWDELEKQRQANKDEIIRIDSNLESFEKLSVSHRNLITEINKKITDLQNNRSTLVGDFKKKLQDTADTLNAGRRDIQKELSTLNKDLSQANIDSSHATLRVTFLNNEISSLDQQLHERVRKYSLDLISSIKDKQEALVLPFRKKAEEKAGQINNQIKDCNLSISQYESDESRANERIEYLNTQIESLDKQLDNLRLEWHTINDQVHDNICPYCGQQLPDKLAKEENAKFEKHKLEQIENNNNRGKSLNQQKKDYIEERDRKAQEITDLGIQKSNLAIKIKSLNEALDKVKTADTDIVLTEIPGYSELQDRLTSLKQQVDGSVYIMGSDDDEGCQSLLRQQQEYQKELTDKSKEIKDIEVKKADLKKQIDLKNEQLLNTPLSTVRSFSLSEVPGYSDAQHKINTLEEELSGLQQNNTTTEDNPEKDHLNVEKNKLNQQNDELTDRLSKRTQIIEAHKEIDRLEKKGQQLTQQLADVEQREFVANQFTKTKIEDCESRINAMFSIVKFQMFEYTIEGAASETCIPLVDGVPYSVTNKASKLNGGLDIINTLCTFNNVSAPIFCDNSESVNHYRTPANSQMIYLKVTEDQKLIIK
jgi:DNA repair exonuclease SbcCD ATPase subunit